jgi:nitrate reductase assembly molybdenum cofactor insertion protein NarJ
MSAPVTMPPGAAELLQEAAEWRLLGLLFEYPDAAWRRDLEALLPSVSSPELRALAEAALELASEGMHSALFGPAGTTPVREVTHRGGVQFGYLLAELAAYYDAFGYATGSPEAPDHLAVQLGFMGFLRLKQVCALLAGETEHAEVAEAAAAEFLKEHLAYQAEPVARALEIFAPDYLAEAGRQILERAGPAPRSGYPLGSPLSDSEEEMSCGPAAASEDLIQLQP